MRSLYIFGLLMVLSGPAPALAARQYHCDGYIQYRPCDQKIGSRRALSSLSGAQQNAIRAMRRDLESATDDDALYAKVVTQQYRRISNTTGQWRGIIEGNGTIRLTLQILRNGSIESSRFMGQVALRNKKTSFNFVSAPPAGANWSWKIVALASEV